MMSQKVKNLKIDSKISNKNNKKLETIKSM